MTEHVIVDSSVQSNCAETSGEQKEVYYASVSFYQNQESPLYSRIRPSPTSRQEEEAVTYTGVRFQSAEASPQSVLTAPVKPSLLVFPAGVKVLPLLRLYRWTGDQTGLSLYATITYPLPKGPKSLVDRG